MTNFAERDKIEVDEDIGPYEYRGMVGVVKAVVPDSPQGYILCKFGKTEVTIEGRFLKKK